MMRHTARPWGGKSCARDGASQVVIGIAVAAGKMRTGEPEDGLDLSSGLALREQVPGDPQIHDAPVRLRKAFAEYAIAAYKSGRSWRPLRRWLGQDLWRSSRSGTARPAVVMDCLTDCNNASARGAKPARAWTSFTHGA